MRNLVDLVVTRARALVASDAAPSADALPASLYAEILRGFALGDLARDVLALAAGAALDVEVAAAVVARAGERTLTVGGAAQILGVAASELALRCASDGPLRQSGLLEPVPPGTPPVRALLLPSKRMLGLLRDRMELLAPVAEVAALVATDEDAAVGVAVDPSVDDLAGLCAALQAQQAGRGPVALVGEVRSGRLRTVLAIAARLGQRRALVVDGGLVSPDVPSWRTLAASLISDASFHVASVVIRDPGLPGLAAATRIAAAGVPCFVTVSEEPPDGRCRLRARVVRPGAAHRLAGWRIESKAVPWLDDARLDRLARDAALSRSEIAAAAGLARACPAGRDADSWISLAARTQVRSRLDQFAKPITRRVTLDDVVLSPDIAGQLRELIDALRARPRLTEVWRHLAHVIDGRGVAALFDGPPGTGKTLSASVIATELDVPLYRIEVSQIVDRYVGETEKNLQRLFREAEACRGILLFDEADSLFAKRVETKDAMDRFANMQVNQLLTLIEDFPGISILTTNLKQGLDPAFSRRIAYKLQFELPERDERAALWRMYLPPNQLSRNEIARLTEKFDRVSGAEIRNGVLRAASTPASLAAGRLTCQQVERSLVAELQSAGSVVSSL